MSYSTVGIASVDLFLSFLKVGEGCTGKRRTLSHTPSASPEHVSGNFSELSEVALLKEKKPGPNLKVDTANHLASVSAMPLQGVSRCDDNEGLSNKYEECLLNQPVQPGPSFTDERYWLFLITLQEVFF